MRPHTADEANAVIDLVEHWQDLFLHATGRRIVHAADEYYLMAGRPFPTVEAYEGFGMYEDGVGIYRTFEQEFQLQKGAQEQVLQLEERPHPPLQQNGPCPPPKFNHGERLQARLRGHRHDRGTGGAHDAEAIADRHSKWCSLESLWQNGVHARRDRSITARRAL